MSVSIQEKNKKITELEEEMSKMFTRSLDPMWNVGLELQRRKQFNFLQDLLDLNTKQEKRAKVREQCIKTYMTSLGETSILQRRIVIMQDLLSWFRRQHQAMGRITDVYESSVMAVLKFVAKTLGFYQPADVLNRVTTLRSVFKDSVKDREDLYDEQRVMNEEHMATIARIGKKNLTLNNMRFQLDSHLIKIQREIRELSTYLKNALATSNQADRTLYQITNTIHSLHDRVTSERGYMSNAKTTSEQLAEIKVRAAILKQTADSLFLTKQKAHVDRLDNSLPFSFGGSLALPKNATKNNNIAGNNNNLATTGSSSKAVKTYAMKELRVRNPSSGALSGRSSIESCYDK